MIIHFIVLVFFVICSGIVGWFEIGTSTLWLFPLWLGYPLLFFCIAMPMMFLEIRNRCMDLQHLVAGFAGLCLGLLTGQFFSMALEILIFGLSPKISMLFTLFFGYLGCSFFIFRVHYFLDVESQKNGGKLFYFPKHRFRGFGLKILDTSSIVDGRILNVVESGFLEGTLIVPKFVMNELHLISDSSDSLKRIRGRRGLDILNRLKKNKKIEIHLLEDDFPNIVDVDGKLVQLSKKLGSASVITTDFSLNKIAQFSEIPVLNIHDLAESLKTTVIPSEEFSVVIVKEGTEENQGVGYLEDGTMIVVENGKKKIGEKVLVVVSSVLQTSAGRMVFAQMGKVTQQ